MDGRKRDSIMKTYNLDEIVERTNDILKLRIYKPDDNGITWETRVKSVTRKDDTDEELEMTWETPWIHQPK